jgi:DNA invertase Pin-like site-specific DNA recombinase
MLKHDKYVLYLRVSTDKQGKSRLGLDAQQTMAAPYMDRVIATYTEVESGKKDDRPELDKALEHCKREGAAILIAKLDRLSRSVSFLFRLRDSGVEIEAADMPGMGTLEFGIRAVFAQHEREEISRRTKAALAEKKARGVKLGCPTPRKGGAATSAAIKNKMESVCAKALPVAQKLRAHGESYRAIAATLNDTGIPAYGTQWHDTGVRNMLENYA